MEAQADPKKVSIRFARSGYESSAIMSSFSPAVIILDSALPEVISGQLPASILKDSRIPAALVAVAYRNGDDGPVMSLPLRFLPFPFSGKAVEELAGRVARGRDRMPLDVAYDPNRQG
jgi:hypothetical protein